MHSLWAYEKFCFQLDLLEYQKLILRIKDVCTALGLSRSTVYRLVEAGDFPAPVKLSRRAVGWNEAQIHHWVNTRNNAADTYRHECDKNK